ncbi:hypothetical protein [Rhodopirellula sp. P2]|uniref:hypothetical protein n=1 Tax=Rhodopirellula sp. P2 TaxID=2127060 RepID=UPI002368A190|nr:hypothetical protein [Rhodopirellula sp. P2]WDQ18871.1 hypothetical protein PSR62_10080 [Rhodopirellula sp. P2]
MTKSKSLSGEKAPKRILWKVLLIALVVSATAVGGGGFYLYRTEQNRLAQAAASSAAMAEQMKVQAEAMKYREQYALSAQDLKAETFRTMFERFPIDVASQQTRLRDAVKARAKVDPHLETALLDVYDAPLVGEDPPIFFADLCDEFMADVELMLEDFVQRNPDLDNVEPITSSLRECLYFGCRSEHPPKKALDDVKEFEATGDPLVLLALLKCDFGDTRETNFERVGKASDRIAESPESFDPVLAALVHSESLLCHAVDRNSDGYDAAVRRFLAAWPVAWQEASSRSPSVGRDHVCLTRMLQAVDVLNSVAQMDFLDGLSSAEQPDVPAFVVHAVIGQFYRRVAWDNRGTSYVSETAPSAMETFGELANVASTHMVEAYLLRPELAMLASAPLGMQMASGSTPLSVHHWFRLSLSGHLDHQRAYDSYDLALMPRWGGSEELQKSIASKCLDTETPDGLVALHSHLFMRRYFTRRTADVSMLDEAGNLMWARRSVDAWRKLSNANRTYRYGERSLGYALQILWEAGQFDDVSALLETIGQRSRIVNWKTHNMDEEEVRFVCRMASGSSYFSWMPIHQQLVFNSERLDQPRIADLIARLEDLEAVWLEDPSFIAERFSDLSSEAIESKREYATRMLARRRTQLNLLDRFHRGEQVKFTVNELAASFIPVGNHSRLELRSSEKCNVEANQLNVELNGADEDEQSGEQSNAPSAQETVEVIADSDDPIGGYQVETDWLDHSFFLWNQVRYPLPARYEVTVTFLDATRSPYGVGLLCGPDGSGGLRNELRGAQVRFCPGARFLCVNSVPEEAMSSSFYKEWSLSKESMRTARLRLDVGERGYKAYLNDHCFHESESPLRTDGLFQVGRCSSRIYTLPPGRPSVCNLFDFQVQRLQQDPFDESQRDDAGTELFDSEEGRSEEGSNDADDFI